VKDDRKCEFVFSRVLRGEFLVAFVDEFVHWYDIIDDCLEFRFIEDPWTSSPDNWRLTRARADSTWHLIRDGISLVRVGSGTAEVLSGMLSPLDDPLRIYIIFYHSSLSLEVELPRLQLGFYFKSGQSSIQSKQFRGMSIDTDQSLGTLVGLRNKLMLKHENGNNRLVVLLEGHVSYEKNSDYVRVIIDKDANAKAHAYYVDDQIGRLVDNGSLQSKLFLCYLHALISFCLPDPLIHRTGIEQALSILNSTLAFAKNADMRIVQTLASFFIVPEMAQISAPWISFFHLSQGATAHKPELRNVVRSALLPFHRCPEAKLSSCSGESTYAFKKRRERQFQSNQDRALSRLIDALEAQWPCEIPAIIIDDSSLEFRTYLDMGKAMKDAKPKFKTWFDNYRFYEYLGQIGDTLWRRMVNPVEMSSSSFTIPVWNLRRRHGFICIDDILACSAPSVLPRGTGNLTDLLSSSTGADKITPRLAALIERLEA
jgi:hypothetical protein